MTDSTQAPDDKPMRVVVVIPPLYLDQDLAQKIKQKTQADHIETDWNEGKPVTAKRSVALVHDFPQIANTQNLAKNTFFVIAGFDKEALKTTVEQVNKLAPQADPSQSNQMAEKFVESRSKEKSVDEMWPEYEKFFANVQNKLPNNYMLVKNISVDDIMQGLDMGFEKLRVMQ